MLRLIERELAGQQATTTQARVSPSLTALPDGEPGSSAVCMTPGCWERNTAKYGLGRLVLRAACAAALMGQLHKRQVPHGADKVIRRGAG